jgi:hypothetical protein
MDTDNSRRHGYHRISTVYHYLLRAIPNALRRQLHSDAEIAILYESVMSEILETPIANTDLIRESKQGNRL